MRLLGAGTVIDSGCFRSLLAEKLNLDARSIHADIIGEHGDSEVPVWSKVNVAGMRIFAEDSISESQSCEADLGEIFLKVKNAAYEIIQRKGYTSYGLV